MSISDFTPEDKVAIQFAIDNNTDLDDTLFTKLFDHFCNNGEMPYGVAKARTGDPYEWIGDHMHEVLE